MKEATGEVSMTVIVIVAVAVIGGILALVWPNIKTMIQNTFTSTVNCPAGTTYDAATKVCK